MSEQHLTEPRNSLFYSPSLSPFLNPSVLQKGLNHSDTAHGVCSFRRPSGSDKSSKMGIERGRVRRAIDILLHVAEPLNILKA